MIDFELKTAAFYEANKKPGDEAYWMGYLDASNDLVYEIGFNVASSSLKQESINLRRLRSQRLKFIKNCEDVIRTEYETSRVRKEAVQTKTIDYNFE